MKAVYLPDIIGGGYRRFWDCRLRYRVVKGGKASKKSSTTALWYIYHLMKYPGANLLVVRSVHRTHADSTYAQLRWAIRRLGVEHLWRAGREPLELCYTPTGQRILFRGLDNVEKLASTTVEQGHLCWVWLEEAFVPLANLRQEIDLSWRGAAAMTYGVAALLSLNGEDARLYDRYLERYMQALPRVKAAPYRRRDTLFGEGV